MASIGAHHGKTATERGGKMISGNEPVAWRQYSIQPPAALKQEAAVPLKRQAQLHTDAEVLSGRPGAGAERGAEQAVSGQIDLRGGLGAGLDAVRRLQAAADQVRSQVVRLQAVVRECLERAALERIAAVLGNEVDAGPPVASSADTDPLSIATSCIAPTLGVAMPMPPPA